MTPEESALYRLLERVGELAVAAALPFIPSTTLQQELKAVVTRGRDPRVNLRLDSYWSYYLHEGRGPVGPKSAQFVVFFRNPQDDPRNEGGYPVRESQRRRLTQSQFQYFLRVNTERRASGQPPVMLVMRTKDFRPISTGPFEGTFFFRDAEPAIADVILTQIQREVEEFVSVKVRRALSRAVPRFGFANERQRGRRLTTIELRIRV